MSQYCFNSISFAVVLLSTVNSSAAEKTVTAKVETIDKAKGSITLDGLTLDVSRKTKITVDGMQVNLSNLKTGQTVRVIYEDALDAAITIEEIKAKDLTEPIDNEFESLIPTEGLDGWYFHKELIGNRPNWENSRGVLVYKSSGTSLISDKKFRDFELQLEFNLPKSCNCGVYLRGRHEVKLTDTPKGSVTTLKPEERIGAIFGRIAASKNAYKGANQWNKLEVRLIDQTVTVRINDVVVINQKEIEGPGTGISLDQNLSDPGPIILFAHPKGVGARFRNIKIKSLNQ